MFDRVVQSVTAAAVVGLFVFVISTKEALAEAKHEFTEAINGVRTDVALLAKDVSALLGRDVIHRVELEKAVRTIIDTHYWGKDKGPVLKRIRRLEHKAGIEEE